MIHQCIDSFLTMHDISCKNHNTYVRYVHTYFPKIYEALETISSLPIGRYVNENFKLQMYLYVSCFIFYDMAAAMRNLNVKTVSKSVKYFLSYDFFKTSNLTHFQMGLSLMQ